MALKDVRLALRALLLADSAVGTAVGNTRVYPGQLPQGLNPSLPAIVYSEISDVGDYTLDGPSGLARPRYQITAWASSADAAVSLGLKIKEAIDGYSGDVSYGTNSPQDTITVRGMFMDLSHDLYDDVLKLHGKSMDYMIWFAER